MSDELKPLSKKHQRVLDEYLVCFKQWEAYQTVYPNVTYDSARQAAARLFADVNFSAHLQARLNEAHMSANEALKLLAEQARSDVGDFLNDFGGIDVSKARKDGKMKLIKRWKTKTITINGKQEDKEIHEEDLELYDAQAAIDKILKVHGKYLERVDLSNSDGTLKPPQIIEIIRPKENE